MSSLVIDLNSLPEFGNSYEFSIESDWFAQALGELDSVVSSKGDQGHVKVMVQRSGKDVLVHGSLKAEIQLRCVRSLEEFMFPVRADLSALFEPAAGSTRGGSTTASEAEADRDVFTGHRLVLDSFVREHIILEIPMNPTCVGPDASLKIPDEVGPAAFDAAVAREEGTDKSTEEGSVDPRLAPLRELARMMGEKKE